MADSHSCCCRIFRAVCCCCCCCNNNEPATSSMGMETKQGREDAEQQPTSNKSHENDVDDSGGSRTSYGSEIVVALYDYKPASPEDLPFKKGDRMRILDKSDGDWWKALHLKTKEKGSIPRNFVASVESLDSEDWYHGKMLRHEAEKLLLSTGTGVGTYLIRESERVTGNFALSLLNWDGELKKRIVLHYIIKCDGNKYTIKEMPFDSLQELVTHYEAPHTGLATRLVTPCPKPEPELWDLSSETKENWEANRDDIQMGKKLGEGNFGEVWEGKYLGKIPVAIKTLKPKMMPVDAFMKEATIMKTTHHKNLVSLYAVCTKDEPIWIITEFMPKGSLLDYLHGKEGKTLPFDVLLDMAIQIAHGMSYLEDRKLIHRDLAARNILVGNKNVVKIADFGLARVLQDEIYNPSSKFNCPIRWTAPEVYTHNQCTVKADIWSFGIVLTEIITRGAVPYYDLTNEQVQQKVPQGHRMKPPFLGHCPDFLYELMKQCWHEEPEDRPNFHTLYSSLNDLAINTTQYEPHQD